MTNEVQSGDRIERGFNTAADAINQGKAVQQIQTKYHTAVSVQKPRDLFVVQDRCLQEAALAGATCFYGWGTGKNRVEGPSVDCAMIAARNFGNVAIEMAPVHETATAWVFDCHVIDLETGFTYPRQFRQSKRWNVHGQFDNERKDDIRFQIGQSKCQRNAILKFMPKWLIDKMIDRAKEGVREKLEQAIKSKGIETVRLRAMEALGRYSVTVEKVERKYGKKYGAWDIDLLVILQGDIAALTSGAEAADTLFPDETDEDQQTNNGSSGPNNGGGLSTDKMSSGNPADHQGHEKQETKAAPAGGNDLLSEVLQLEQKAELGKKVVDFRVEHAGLADLAKAAREGLLNYRAFLVDRIDVAEREAATAGEENAD